MIDYPYPSYGAGLNSCILAIVEERIAQFHEHPSAADDDLTPAEWIARLAKHLGRAVTLDPPTFRRQMVRVAAICVAAIESFDRRFPDG